MGETYHFWKCATPNPFFHLHSVDMGILWGRNLQKSIWYPISHRKGYVHFCRRMPLSLKNGIWARSAWSEPVLHDLNRFCVVWACFAWSMSVMCDTCFCSARSEPAWSVPLLHDLCLFCMIWAFSVCSKPVLPDLSLFCMIWASSAWTEPVLCDMCLFWMICTSYPWSESQPHE